jgi:hypothetical protein
MAEDSARELERGIAVDCFNGTWSLLDKSDRTADEDARMLHMAHTSVFHWGNVGTPVNAVRGEWQCSRVYAVLGRAEPALYHAQRALDICTRNDIGGFDLAFCCEALARAHSVAGDLDQAADWVRKARALADDITDAEDRDLLLADLQTVHTAS